MPRTIPMGLPVRDPATDNQRLIADARSALDALLAKVTRSDCNFYGKIAIEISVQRGVLGHVKEIIERTRK